MTEEERTQKERIDNLERMMSQLTTTQDSILNALNNLTSQHTQRTNDTNDESHNRSGTNQTGSS